MFASAVEEWKILLLLLVGVDLLFTVRYSPLYLMCSSKTYFDGEKKRGEFCTPLSGLLFVINPF